MTDTVNALSRQYAGLLRGVLPLSQGCRVVFSRSHMGYFLLWAEGFRESALEAVHWSLLCPPRWAPEQAFNIGLMGIFVARRDGIALLDMHSWRSVEAAVEALNDRSLCCNYGVCVAFSESKQTYFLLWRSDKAYVASRYVQGGGPLAWQ